MGKKSVDVVLLPGKEVMDEAIRLNRQLVAKFGAKIVLDKEKCLPHISLAMGCINDRDIPEATGLLNRIAKENPLGELQIMGIVISENARGEKISSFEVERTEKLQKLHERIMEAMEPYFSCDVTEDTMYPSGKIAELTLIWIRNYREKSSFENFRPHITLGYGVIDNPEFSLPVKASKLALCHLGNHCTCRKVLFSVEM